MGDVDDIFGDDRELADYMTDLAGRLGHPDVESLIVRLCRRARTRYEVAFERGSYRERDDHTIELADPLRPGDINDCRLEWCEKLMQQTDLESWKQLLKYCSWIADSGTSEQRSRALAYADEMPRELREDVADLLVGLFDRLRESG